MLLCVKVFFQQLGNPKDHVETCFRMSSISNITFLRILALLDGHCGEHVFHKFLIHHELTFVIDARQQGEAGNQSKITASAVSASGCKKSVRDDCNQFRSLFNLMTERMHAYRTR